MVHDTDLGSKTDSIGKAVDNLRGLLESPLSRIKVGLEKSYLNLYRKGIGALDHSAKKCLRKGKQ